MPAKSQFSSNVSGVRLVAFLLILFSVAELVIGGFTYAFLSDIHFGCWWGAVGTLLAGFLGCLATIRLSIIVTCVVSVFGLIAAIAGAVIDCNASSIIGGQKGCVNTENYREWGSREGVYFADECTIQYMLSATQDDVFNVDDDYSSTFSYTGGNHTHYDWYYNHRYNYYYNQPDNPYRNQSHSTFYYYSQNHLVQDDDDRYFYYSGYTNFYYNHPYYFQNHYGFTHPYQCVCSDSQLCYGYDLTTGDDCGSILTTYTSLLYTSTALLSVLCLLSFILAALTGFRACSDQGSSSVLAADSDPTAHFEVQLASNKAPLYMVTPIEVQEGGSLPPGANVVMMVMSQQQPQQQQQYNGGVSSSTRRARPTQLPTVMED